MKKFLVYFYAAVCLVVLVTVIVFTINVISNFVNSNTNTTTSNQESVDSILNTRSIIILETNNLDSIKNAKVIEVGSLDDDSTIKLFRKLVHGE